MAPRLAAAIRTPDWNDTDEEKFMRYTIAVVLPALWLRGLVTSSAKAAIRALRSKQRGTPEHSR